MKNASISSKAHATIKKHHLITPKSTVIVGLSGGPDSVFLLRMLNELKYERELNVIAAHVDHGWRPESEKEAQFCRQLCDELGVQLVVQKLSEVSATVKFNGSREEYARRIRRHFFEQCAQKHGAVAIALGHHADDQIETFFIRLVRGASTAGLAGMQPRQGLYIRPLLDCHKQEITQYLEQHNYAYVVDASNQSDEFLRNRIRSQLLPVFETIDSRAKKNLMSAMQQIQRTESYLAQHTDQQWQSIARKNDDTWLVDSARLLDYPVSMRHRLIMQWLVFENVPFVATQDFFAEIERFLARSGSKEHCMHQKWSIRKKKNVVSIAKY